MNRRIWYELVAAGVELVRGAPDLHEDVLGDVLGLGRVVEDPERRGPHTADVLVVDGGEGLRVAQVHVMVVPDVEGLYTSC